MNEKNFLKDFMPSEHLANQIEDLGKMDTQLKLDNKHLEYDHLPQGGRAEIMARKGIVDEINQQILKGKKSKGSHN